MEEHYSYDELYGTLLSNKLETERTYFVIECDYWKFYRWMFINGWNKIRGEPCERNGLKGYEVVLRKYFPAM